MDNKLQQPNLRRIHLLTGISTRMHSTKQAVQTVFYHDRRRENFDEGLGTCRIEETAVKKAEE